MLAAAHAHHADTVIRTLVSAGADVNVSGGGPERRTALHYAAARGLDPGALLEARVDLQAVDSLGNTALHIAASGGHSTFVRIVLQSGSDEARAGLIRAVNEHGQTAFHLASGCGSVDCMHAIVELASSPDDVITAVDKDGRLPVWYAAVNGHYEAVVGLLRLNGRAVDATTTASESAAMAALDKCHVRVARALLVAGSGGPGVRGAVGDWVTETKDRNSMTWIEEHRDEIDWLERFTETPSDLRHLSRLTIRYIIILL